MFDPLLEEDPWVQEYGSKREARGEARGEAKGEARGEIKATRQSIALVVHARFSALEKMVMDSVERLQNIETLKDLLVALSTASDEHEARNYLLSLQNDK